MILRFAKRFIVKAFFEIDTEAALQRCFYEKVFWKYAVNLQENTHGSSNSETVMLGYISCTSTESVAMLKITGIDKKVYKEK